MTDLLSAGRLRAALLTWYDGRRRDLPWRRTRDPYAIWVSEIMLQQTRVESALPYFERFLARFATVRDLARADEEEVLAHWSGLGYYSRARNLHRSARAIDAQHGGRFPDTYASARALPGVGPYTAAAVLSIAYGHAHAVVDGNVARVLSRWRRLAPPDDRPAALQALAQELLDPARPGDFNQAMMELGATLCTPVAPGCDTCPVTSWCRARHAGDVASYPVPRARAPVVAVRETLLLLRDRAGRLFLERGRWQWLRGMWLPPILSGLPRVERARVELRSIERALRVSDRALPPLARGSLRSVGAVRHTITNHRLDLDVVAVRTEALRDEASAEARWVPDDEIGRLGRSAILTKALALEASSA